MHDAKVHDIGPGEGLVHALLEEDFPASRYGVTLLLFGSCMFKHEKRWAMILLVLRLEQQMHWVLCSTTLPVTAAWQTRAD